MWTKNPGWLNGYDRCSWIVVNYPNQDYSGNVQVHVSSWHTPTCLSSKQARNRLASQLPRLQDSSSFQHSRCSIAPRSCAIWCSKPASFVAQNGQFPEKIVFPVMLENLTPWEKNTQFFPMKTATWVDKTMTPWPHWTHHINHITVSTVWGFFKNRDPQSSPRGLSILSDGFLSHRGSPRNIIQFIDWDYPWTKPSSELGVPPWLWKPINRYQPYMNHIFTIYEPYM